MGTEASVKRLDTAGGKDVRTLEVTTFINGQQTTVEMQVVALADMQGNPLSLEPGNRLLEELVAESRLQTAALLKLLDATGHQAMSRDELVAELEESSLPKGDERL